MPEHDSKTGHLKYSYVIDNISIALKKIKIRRIHLYMWNTNIMRDLYCSVGFCYIQLAKRNMEDWKVEVDIEGMGITAIGGLVGDQMNSIP